LVEKKLFVTGWKETLLSRRECLESVSESSAIVSSAK
jgi:hypothetical protein